MPRSSKAPEPPPEPDVNELIQNDVAKIKRLLGLDVNRLALGSEVEGIVGTGVFGPADYTITGVNVIEFVNVSTSLGPSQGGSPPPPQVTGLSASVISDTQINLAWTAYGGSDFNFYTVYRGTSPGFSADSSSDIATPTTNSYNNTGLTAGTSYYYRVATTNDANQEGPLSAEVSGTTTGGGDVTPPGQVTGLTASVISDTQINLSWTASTAGDLNHYDVHRSTTTGFTPAVGNRISQPSTNSYNNTGLTAATTYYYKVAAVDNAANIGTYSTQASGTTTSTGAGTPTALWHLDNNFTDSATSPMTVGGNNGNGFATPGQFGTHYWRCNTPTDMPGGNVDNINQSDVQSTKLGLDLTTGFSISFWIYPTDISALPYRRVIMEQNQSNTFTSGFSIQLSSGGTVYFFVRKGGVDYKIQKGGFVVNAWQHVAVTFDGATNTVALYKDASNGATSTQPTQLDNWGSDITYLIIGSALHRDAIVNLTDTRYAGRLDEIQYFKGVVLTPTQVTNLRDNNTP